MDFYYLKLGPGNKLAKPWLDGDNPLRRPAVFVYFGKATIDQILRADPAADPYLRYRNRKQALDFINSARPERRANVVMVVVAKGRIWFLQPDGDIVEYQPAAHEVRSDALWKILPVKIIAEKGVADVPAVLAGINSDKYLVMGTYSPIRHWGNIMAIHHVLGLPLPPEHLETRELTATRILECLGSVGLETLVAKLLEAAGCFVPAYRGGGMQGVDLFAHNDGSRSITVGDMLIPPGESKSIQVKSKEMDEKEMAKNPLAADCLIALKGPPDAACYDAEWLLEQVRGYPQVLAWLERSLSWLPAEFLAHYDLHPAPIAA